MEEVRTESRQTATVTAQTHASPGLCALVWERLSHTGQLSSAPCDPQPNHPPTPQKKTCHPGKAHPPVFMQFPMATRRSKGAEHVCEVGLVPLFPAWRITAPISGRNQCIPMGYSAPLPQIPENARAQL